MVVIYNLHWFLVTKDKSYLYYSVFKSLLILTVVLSSVIIPDTPLYLHITVTALLIFIILFTQELLDLRRDFNAIYKLLNAVIVTLIIGNIICTYLNEYSIYKQPYSLVISPLVVIGYFAHRHGNDAAKYFVISWTVGNLLLAVSDLNTFEIIEFHPEIPFDLIAGILDSIILSYAIFVKTRTIISEKEEQSKILIHQSKLATSGQMLENISHQWNQPLNRISAFIINMQAHIYAGQRDQKFLVEALEQSQLQLEYMANTLNDFTHFHSKDSEQQTFLASFVVEEVRRIIGLTLELKNIEFRIQVTDDFSVHSFPNELSQVILNLVQNAQDELLSRKTENAYINIIINKNTITVQDNAGGIDDDISKYIFEAYFTTKDETSSLGLGLYMCKMILSKYFNTQLNLEQTNDCTSFSMSFDTL